ncbi:MAG: hypothetical protein AB9835_08085 [Eubacteriales bacterium]
MNLVKRWVNLLFISFGGSAIFLTIFQQFGLYKADRLPKMLLEIFILLFFYTLLVLYLEGIRFKYKIHFHVISQIVLIILLILTRTIFSIDKSGAINTQAIFLPAASAMLVSLVYLIIMFFVLRAEVRQINEKLKKMRDK